MPFWKDHLADAWLDQVIQPRANCKTLVNLPRTSESPSTPGGIGPTEEDVSLIWPTESANTTSALQILRATSKLRGLGNFITAEGGTQLRTARVAANDEQADRATFRFNGTMIFFDILHKSNFMKTGYTYRPVVTRCPFCLFVGGKMLYEVTSEEATLHFVAPWRNPKRNGELRSIIERLWGKPTCQVIECDNCAGVFAWPFVGGDAAFYETANAEQKNGSYPGNRWEFGETVRLLSDPCNACTVEIGAGDGAFVRRLINAGVDPARITALEYSPYGADAIRARYPGVNLRHGDELGSLPDGAFTHAFLFQVLEHLGNVDSYMQNLCRILRPGGAAFISVPHPSRTKLHELSGLTLDMPPNHISRFNRAAFADLASRNGLQLETMSDEPFSWRQAFPEFLLFRFLRLSQEQGSMADRIHTRLTGKSHKRAASLLALTWIPHALLRLSTNEKTGGSRLFVVRKP